MVDEGTRRKLPARTGRYFCASCLKEISGEEYFSGDHYCSECAAKAETYPNASTPAPAERPERKGGRD